MYDFTAKVHAAEYQAGAQYSQVQQRLASDILEAEFEVLLLRKMCLMLDNVSSFANADRLDAVAKAPNSDDFADPTNYSS